MYSSGWLEQGHEDYCDHSIVMEVYKCPRFGSTAHQHRLDDERNSSPKEVLVQIPQAHQSGAANLKSLCRDSGIVFGFVGEMSRLPWGCLLVLLLVSSVVISEISYFEL
jgi:hypothetical protein